MSGVEIPLRNGGFCLVSPQDVDLVAGGSWRAIKSSSATYVHHIRYFRGVAVDRVQMHRLLMAPPAGMVVDHVNGNGLDNRRENLRVATAAENSWNRRLRSDNKTGFRGVTPAAKGRFYATFSYRGQSVRLGSFPTAEEAARAWDAQAKIYHGAFASLNFGPRITAQRAGMAP